VSVEVERFFSTFAGIFSFSFVVALSGAMSPGPLLTYTIVRSVRAKSRGYLMGVWVITGHALLEMAVIILLLLGFSLVLKNDWVVRGIGVLGGIILLVFGISMLRDIFRGRVSTEFLDPGSRPAGAAVETRHGSGGRPARTGQGAPDPFPGTRATPVPENAAVRGDRDMAGFGRRAAESPVLGGALVSMANPYWWVWWATIGLAFMVKFEISFQSWPKLAAFFLGHEAGDLVWYLVVSFFSYFGLRRLNQKVYYGILLACAIFMILFGVWLGVSPFFRNGV